LSPIFSFRAKTGSEASHKKYSVSIPGELLKTVKYPFAYPKRVVVLFRKVKETKGTRIGIENGGPKECGKGLGEFLN
tara:strand:+ start:629 stop:859 length:231 start_codon:yes stop_codon:yes gene_type:complete